MDFAIILQDINIQTRKSILNMQAGKSHSSGNFAHHRVLITKRTENISRRKGQIC